MIKLAFEKLFKMRESASRARPGADDGYDAHEKPFLDHLEDLRTTLMKIGGTLAISTALCFTFHKKIFELIQVPPKLKLAELDPGISLWDKLQLITLEPPEFIILMLKLSFFSGVIISFPFTIYFLFQFIIPGLRQAEKKTVIPGALVGFALFLVGASFAFFFAAPIALKFLYKFEIERVSNLDPMTRAMERPIANLPLVGANGVPFAPVTEGAEVAPEEPSTLTPELKAEIRDYIRGSFATIEKSNLALRYDETRDKLVLIEAKGDTSVYQIGKYITFIARLVLVFGISFQLPVIVTILVKLELLTARVMRSTRTYAWIIILVAAAILTPPDLFTLGLLGGPMILLYEICIVIASIIERGREKRRLAELEAEQGRLAALYSKPSDDLTEEEKQEMHRAEIEQYEREHAHLYDHESAHPHEDGSAAPDSGPIPRDSFIGEEHHAQYDESWHEDHEGMESDHAEPIMKAEDFEQEPCEPDGPVVDLNHATLEELESLPGVDFEIARNIIDHRPYSSFDDLELIPDLTPAMIAAMMDRLMLG